MGIWLPELGAMSNLNEQESLQWPEPSPSNMVQTCKMWNLGNLKLWNMEPWNHKIHQAWRFQFRKVHNQSKIYSFEFVRTMAACPPKSNVCLCGTPQSKITEPLQGLPRRSCGGSSGDVARGTRNWFPELGTGRQTSLEHPRAMRNLSVAVEFDTQGTLQDTQGTHGYTDRRLRAPFLVFVFELHRQSRTASALFDRVE